MKTIHKVALSHVSEFCLLLPVKAKLVHAAMQDGMPRGWVELVKSDDYVARLFKVFGTGEQIPDGAVHLCTYPDRSYIWHLYELP